MTDVLPLITPRLIGTSVLRSEDPRLLTGNGEFVADIFLPRMLHACVLRSPHARAMIKSIDTSAAASMPGVHLVWTGADTSPRCTGIAAGLDIEGFKGTVQPVLATTTVRYVGEGIAVVVADSRHIAEDACDLIQVDYEPLPAVVDAEAALAGGPIANDTLADNVILERAHTVGDLDLAFATAAVTVAGRFVNNRYAAAPIECRGSIARYEWTSNQLTLWTATQVPHFIRSTIAKSMRFPEHNLEVIAPDVGGGFGQKANLFAEELLVCLLSLELKRPVKWIEDRRENLMTATHAKQQINDMALAFDADGRLLALRDRVDGDGGAYNTYPWTHLIEAMAGTSSITSVYKVPALHTHFAAIVTNKCPVGAYRGIGCTAPQIAREALFDRAGRELGLSPFEIRRRNVVQPGDFPYTAATGLVHHEGSFLETVDTLEKVVGYEAFLDRQKKARAAGVYLGLGVSLFSEVSGIGTAAAYAVGFPVSTHDTSTVRIEPTGKVVVTTSITSQGQGQHTSLAQVTADALGVRMEDVVVRSGSTSQTYGHGTWGGRGAVIGAGSIMRAVQVLREKILDFASDMLEAASEDLLIENGQILVAGSPDRSVPLARITEEIYFPAKAHKPGFDPTLEVTAAYDPAGVVLSSGGHAAIVEVDSETGLIKLEKFFAVEDCGLVINPMIVEGQIRGGVAQAIGAAVLEDLIYDENGQLLTTTFMDYLLPTSMEVPDVDVTHIETPSAFTPGGIKGMGESAMISAPAAIVNAVNDALSPFGAFIQRFPLTPDRILEAVAGNPAPASPAL
ncbi:MAG TPA: molybdopterin cofactor-binding domain-containing protein [Candidatus Dormibacteraeota bacterium]